MTDLNTIKKELYRRDTKAILQGVKKGFLYYATDPVKIDGLSLEYCPVVRFAIPFEDIGDAEFFSVMSAKHLIRYIVLPETNK